MNARDDQLRAALDEALRTTPSTGNSHKPGEEKWDHHPRPGEQGHKYTYTCALCRNDLDALLPALVAAVERVQDARAEQAEAERDQAQAALERVRELHQPTEGLGYGCDEDDIPGSYGHIAQVCTSCGTADEYGVRWPCPTIRALDGTTKPNTPENADA